MKTLALFVLPLCVLAGCCTFNAQATSVAVKDWALLKPYTEQGIRASTLSDEEKQIRLDLVKDFTDLLGGMNSNAE